MLLFFYSMYPFTRIFFDEICWVFHPNILYNIYIEPSQKTKERCLLKCILSCIVHIKRKNDGITKALNDMDVLVGKCSS